MKAGVCLQLSNALIVTRGVVAALSKPDRDAWRRRGLIEANLLQIVTRGVVAALSKPIYYRSRPRRGRVLIEPT